jgi:uncharacterized protein YceH (UPF0502 family)
MEGEAAEVPPLDAVARRVLGSLIEKERATPQNYPLTLNALRLACNQSTNREPVTDYDDHTIEATLGWLREERLIRIVYSPSNRAAKYRHVLDDVLGVADDELSVLCVLLLRGPQTAGEIKGRTERLFPFADLAAVHGTLDRLIERQPRRLVVRLERQPGQKDARFAHLLGDTDPAAAAPAPPAPAAPAAPAPRSEPAWSDGGGPTAPASSWGPEAAVPAPAPDDDLRERVEQLEAELAQLRAEFDALRAEFD